jgi:hypothetical protein
MNLPKDLIAPQPNLKPIICFAQSGATGGGTRSCAIRAPPAIRAAIPGLHRPTCHEPDYHHNHSDHQNNVDQASGDMERETEKPQDE